ncbi:glutaminyl-peptide cyclotransferase-like [Ylistrum balloti]|uniref:glutaminyl-peptide cyclotransferase-like n=1 Tax=Ylistrum balloti TaxID=509963 RepID=UPI002905869D|nr:glutaminyl-peptide cyclotransferase-like [Ylistrum balloti]
MRYYLFIVACCYLYVACDTHQKTTQQQQEIAQQEITPLFSGEKAYEYVKQQAAFGPRPTGSNANKKLRQWLTTQLQDNHWAVSRQQFQSPKNTVSENIIATRGEGRTVLLGAHYDTRLISDEDQDTTQRQNPGIGANDGASGVAVLLELARILKPEELDLRICLAFFDAEDNGNIDGWQWILGSSYYVENPGFITDCDRPNAVVVVDMVGDRDLQIYRDFGATASLETAPWQQAKKLKISAFQANYRYRILDDHVPFLRQGIPAAILIDFEYPYWHTTEDTVDKVTASSLSQVGQVIEAWITNGAQF